MFFAGQVTSDMSHHSCKYGQRDGANGQRDGANGQRDGANGVKLIYVKNI